MLKRYILNLTVFVILVLILLSVVSAFIGPVRTEDILNTFVSASIWIIFIIFSVAGIFLFKSIYKRPALFAIHVGFVLIIIGSMFNSRKGHEFLKKFGIHKVFEGKQVIHESDSEKRVRLRSGDIEDLPFKIKLKNFRIEHYQPYVIFRPNRQMEIEIKAVKGNKREVLPDGSMLEVLKTYKNFKIVSDEERKAVDSNETGYNPAVKVRVTSSEGMYFDRFLFSKRRWHGDDGNFEFSYKTPIRDFISDIEIIKQGEVVKSESVEVNHPLHYGGYHFYQYSYDSEQGRYTVLKVVSDTGLSIVYTGYILMGLGIVWQFWFKKLIFKK